MLTGEDYVTASDRSLASEEDIEKVRTSEIKLNNLHNGGRLTIAGRVISLHRNSI